jgi:hypothetical protein
MFWHLCAIFRERPLSLWVTVHGYIQMTQQFSDFQVTHKDKGRSLKMAHKCQNM